MCGCPIYTYTYTYLLLISMLWHRQAIFESKEDKLSSSDECRIRTQGLRHLFASRLNARWQTDWAIEDQAIKLELDSPSLWSASIQPTRHIYIYIYIYIYIHTYIHTCICICICIYTYILEYKWKLHPLNSFLPLSQLTFIFVFVQNICSTLSVNYFAFHQHVEDTLLLTDLRLSHPTTFFR